MSGKIRKKAQQEMLGFAFVIVLVVVIGIAFLLLTLRQASFVAERENVRVNNLLNGISYYTTDCESKNIQQLIIACRRGDLIECNGMNVCTFMENEISQILESSLKGDYAFTVEFASPTVGDIELKRGACPGERVALSAISVLPNGISVKLLSCPVPE